MAERAGNRSRWAWVRPGTTWPGWTRSQRHTWRRTAPACCRRSVRDHGMRVDPDRPFDRASRSAF